MKKKRILSMVITGSILMGVLVACTPSAQPAPTPAAPAQTPAATTPAAPTQTPVAPPVEAAQFQRGITVANMAEPSTVMPARHTTLVGSFVNAMTHNGLFRLDENLVPVPDLAYEVIALSDTLFEMRLHQNVYFHNGDHMTAYDIAAAFEYVRTYPEQRANQQSVQSWEVVDTYTIRIDSGEPNAMLFSELAGHGNFIFPRSLIEAGYDFSVNPVGTGPFVFEEWRAGDFMHFNAFDNYFDQGRLPSVGYVHWRIIPEGTSRTIALEMGEVDYVIDVALPDVARLKENPDITVMERPGVMFQNFQMNAVLAPTDNIHVRRAVDMALDREAMMMVALDGYGIVISQATPPIFAGSSTVGTRSFDPDGARALLAEHGIDPATIGFEILAFDEQHRRRAEVAQSNLMDIGIPTTITMIEFATWLTHTFDYTAWNFTFANQSATSLPAFLRGMSHSQLRGTANRANHIIPELDALIDQAFATIDDDARVAIMEQASIILNEYAALNGINMALLFRAFDANLVVPELAANGFMFKNMIYWNE